jgi:hypothetical protein
MSKRVDDSRIFLIIISKGFVFELLPAERRGLIHPTEFSFSNGWDL